MWHNGDYRIIFRHERQLTNERVFGAMCEMYDEGLIGCLSRDSDSSFSVKAVEGVEVMTVAVLQKKITDGELMAWSTLGVGYSFSQWDDVFTKGKGRKEAFLRALAQVSFDPPVHRNSFLEAYEKHTNHKFSIVGELNDSQVIKP